MSLRKYFSFPTASIIPIILLFFLAACGSKAPRPEPEWVRKPDGVYIQYTADPMLNEYNGRSHALQLVIYQMDSANKFMELAEYRDGIKKLLAADNFDPSVQAIKKIFVNPGESSKLVFDRAEKSRWVGIAAGYFDLLPGRVTCLFEIPYHIEKQGVFVKKEIAVISDLKLQLTLKEREIKGIMAND